MKHKFTLEYLKSIPKDEFIHWTGVHKDTPDIGKWGYCKGYIWNDKLKAFLDKNPNVKFINDQQDENSHWISRYFDDGKVIIATNDDAGIMKVIDKSVRGVEGTLKDNISIYLSSNWPTPTRVNLESKDLYVVTSPEPNGGTFPKVYDIFNNPTNIKRIYSKGLMCTDNEKFRAVPNGICSITIEPLRDKILFQEPKRNDNLAVLNFRLGTNEERDKILHYYSNQPWATVGNGKQIDYLKEMYNHKFVISPESNCADSHRTWEAMYLGTIPIVQKTPGMSWFDDLPILQVDDMCSLTQEFLEEKYEEMMSKEYNLDKLKLSYWLDIIQSDLI